MALTKIGKEGITGVSNASNATFLTATSAEGVTLAGTLAVTGVHTIGNNAVATSEGGAVTTNVVQGLAKAWANYVGSGTTLADSFNTTSATDHGTGAYTITWNNDFANATYAGNFLTMGSSTGNTACYCNLYHGGMAAGSLRVNHFNQAAEAVADSANVSASGHGDLA